MKVGLSVNKESVSLKTLAEQIEMVRKRMQRLWDEKGHTDMEVLNISIELDDLLNEYQRRISFLREKNASKFPRLSFCVDRLLPLFERTKSGAKMRRGT